MDPLPKLTARQQQILELIQQAIELSGAPPTRAEIAAQLGFKSVNAAEEHLQALARKGVIELIGGTSRGIRLSTDNLRSVHYARLKPAYVPNLDQLTIPLVGRVAAGEPILAQEHIEQTFTVEASLFTARPDYLLKVKGMSMRDVGILDGDLLAVQKASVARNGQIVVARLGDEVTVKRFNKNHEGIQLLPENPDFRPLIVLPYADFSIEGLAIGLIRNQFLNL